MIKFLVSLISLFITSTAICAIEITESNFPDANFRNWVLSQDYGKDGMLTDSEISDIVIIGVTARDIQTLKGIEYFTELKVLSCSNNQLVSLDLSKNTSLEVLYCSSNKLSSLNVSECKLLKSLTCYSNQLKSLDVSKNPALTLFNCWGNKLTSLDVSKNAELEELYCHFNQLAFLDVSQNAKLATLYCNNNEITSLDVSRNSALAHLYCYWNRLASLDVSGCTSLTDLQCNTNQLTSLDLSKNMALISLYCYNNQLYGENMDALVASLPTMSEGYLYVVNKENEGNIMTTLQVEAAKAKGWIPYYSTKDDNWEEYAGSKPEVEKCATPTIALVGGRLRLNCETDGAKLHYKYSFPDGGEGVEREATIPQIIIVSVYATKDGFENSDVATKEIDLGAIGIRGDVNNDGQVSMPDAMFIVNKILNGKFPDEDLELEKAGVRFGFYEEVPGYSVKINKITVTGLRVAEFGSVGTTLKESNSDITFDKTDGSYTNVYFKDANENPQMVVEVDYTLTSDDGTGETFTGKTITNIGLQNITQWEPNKNYTFIFKVVPTYLYGGIIDVEHPSIYFESVNVEGSGGMTR